MNTHLMYSVWVLRLQIFTVQLVPPRFLSSVSLPFPFPWSPTSLTVSLQTFQSLHRHPRNPLPLNSSFLFPTPPAHTQKWLSRDQKWHVKTHLSSEMGTVQQWQSGEGRARASSKHSKEGREAFMGPAKAETSVPRAFCLEAMKHPESSRARGTVM